MAWSGYNSFERVAPGTGPQGAATGLILERLAQSRIAANLVAGTAIGASMLTIGVIGMPGAEGLLPDITPDIPPPKITTTLTREECEAQGGTWIESLLSFFGLAPGGCRFD